MDIDYYSDEDMNCNDDQDHMNCDDYDDYEYEYNELEPSPTLRELLEENKKPRPYIPLPQQKDVVLKKYCTDTPLWADFMEDLPKQFVNLGKAPKRRVPSGIYQKTLKKNFKFPKIQPKHLHKKTRICINILKDKTCMFNYDCNFAHRFLDIECCDLKSCKFVTRITDNLYINNGTIECKLRHKDENIESYLLRLQIKTSRNYLIIMMPRDMCDLHIKQILKNAKACQISELVVHIIG
jgi:hypothetical protein